MRFDGLLTDDIFIVESNGKHQGPIKASVQGTKIYVFDKLSTIKEGNKILRSLPNGRSESYTILGVTFHEGPANEGLSHSEIATQKDSALVETPSSGTTKVSGSYNIQIGDGNIKNIVESLEVLLKSIELSDVSADQKAGVKKHIKSFLDHPIISSVLGNAADNLLSTLR